MKLKGFTDCIFSVQTEGHSWIVNVSPSMCVLFRRLLLFVNLVIIAYIQNISCMA